MSKEEKELSRNVAVAAVSALAARPLAVAVEMEMSGYAAAVGGVGGGSMVGDALADSRTGRDNTPARSGEAVPLKVLPAAVLAAGRVRDPSGAAL